MNTQNNSTGPVPQSNPVLRPVGGADPLPSAGAPAVRAGAPVIPKGQARTYVRPRAAETRVGPKVAEELHASSAVFASVVSPRVASADDLANAIDFAVAWHEEAQAASSWQRYCSQQTLLAWRAVQGILDVVRPVFSAAAAADPAVASELPLLATFLDVRSASARRAAVTKRRKEAEKKPQTAKGAGAEPTPIAASPAPAAK